MLLPLYAEIGVPGAAEQVALIQQDEPMLHAVSRLSALYQEEDLMTSIPIEI